MKYSDPDLTVALTPQWQGDRFDDGRPRVADDVLSRLEKVSTEEAWAVCHVHGYKYQFEAGLTAMHPERILVGRAVTAVFVPTRPDLHDCLMKHGQEREGRIGMMNSWVIETLVKDDVMVIDMFDKIFQGTYSGGNLSNAIAARGGRGQVLWCGIRDVQQVKDIDGLITFYRGNDPTGIGDVTLTGINVPCRIGKAICMPGDVVLGTIAGILFIPPHLAEECCIRAERTQLRETFQFQRIHEGVYNSHEMDSAWSPEIEADFHSWRKDNTPEHYQHLEFEEDKAAEDQATSDEAGTVL